MKRKKSISVVLDQQIIDKVDAEALAKNRSRSNMVENILIAHYESTVIGCYGSGTVIRATPDTPVKESKSNGN